MTAVQIPADDPGFDQSSAEAFAAIVQALRTLGVERQAAERYAFAAQLAAAPILLAAGRKQAAADICAHAEAIGWYEGGGVWAEAIEIVERGNRD